jgi:hypothetical protein
MLSKNTQIQLILNGDSSVNLLAGADSNYVSKATQAIKNTMLESPAALCVKTLEYLNAINAILSKENAQLVATARARQQAKKGKQTLGKVRVLSKEDAEKLRANAEAKKAAEIAKKIAIGQKRKEQALKKAQQEAEKTERAHQRAVAKDTRDTNAEMARMANSYARLFDQLPI